MTWSTYKTQGVFTALAKLRAILLARHLKSGYIHLQTAVITPNNSMQQ